MKKVALVLTMLLLCTLLLCACKPPQWSEQIQRDIDKVKELGFTVYMDNSSERIKQHNQSWKETLERDGETFSVETVNICGLVKDLKIVVFEEFKTEEQAKNMYEYCVKAEGKPKYVLLGKVLVLSTSDEASELLGYDFK